MDVPPGSILDVLARAFFGFTDALLTVVACESNVVALIMMRRE
jgi:hypothetical protein